MSIHLHIKSTSLAPEIRVESKQYQWGINQEVKETFFLVELVDIKQEVAAM